MKKKGIFTGAVVAIIALVGNYLSLDKSQQTDGLSDIQLANIEALANIELPEIVISCNRGYQGYCFEENMMKWAMCGEYMFRPCQWTGRPKDYCTQPC